MAGVKAKVMAVAMTGTKSLGFRSPVAVYNELLLNMELAKSSTKHKLLWLVLESALS